VNAHAGLSAAEGARTQQPPVQGRRRAAAAPPRRLPLPRMRACMSRGLLGSACGQFGSLAERRVGVRSGREPCERRDEGHGVCSLQQCAHGKRRLENKLSSVCAGGRHVSGRARAPLFFAFFFSRRAPRAVSRRARKADAITANVPVMVPEGTLNLFLLSPACSVSVSRGTIQ
jgi:hypothetical protein